MRLELEQTRLKEANGERCARPRQRPEQRRRQWLGKVDIGHVEKADRGDVARACHSATAADMLTFSQASLVS